MNKYNKNNPLKCFFAFEGYNSQGLALNKIKQYDPTFEWVCVGRSEIDKYAIQAANALFPESSDKNYGDISKIDWNEVSDFDLFTYSFPCQDISSAGRQRGLQEGSGTRSSLLWECQEAIEIKRPKYCLMENVAALVSGKFLPFFLEWERLMCRYGYTNYNKVLNAKDYGIPQNRERIFMVSIHNADQSYYWPEPFKLGKRLKDVLEQNVDERYYLSQKLINYVFSNGGVNKNIQGGINVSDGDGNAGALTANYYKSPRQGNYIKENGQKTNKVLTSGKIGGGRIYELDTYNQQVYEEIACTILTNINTANHHFIMEKAIEPYNTDKDGCAKTILADAIKFGSATLLRQTGSTMTSVLERDTPMKAIDSKPQVNFRIRKLTERECFRLMGVSETDIDKIQASGVSRSQQYRMAGNSIVVDVLEHIFRKMFVNTGQESQQLSLF